MRDIILHLTREQALILETYIELQLRAVKSKREELGKSTRELDEMYWQATLLMAKLNLAKLRGP